MDECLFGGSCYLLKTNKFIHILNKKAKHFKGMDKFVLEVSRWNKNKTLWNLPQTLNVLLLMDLRIDCLSISCKLTTFANNSVLSWLFIFWLKVKMYSFGLCVFFDVILTFKVILKVNYITLHQTSRHWMLQYRKHTYMVQF